MIRQARTQDVEGILELGIECHKGAATRFPVDKFTARRFIAKFVQSKQCFAWVCEADGELLGALLGGMDQVWYSEKEQATDLFFYVRRDPRSTGSGIRLLKRFMEWGYERGAAGFSIAVSYGGPTTDTTGELFKLLGFQAVGNMYFHHDQLPEKKP